MRRSIASYARACWLSGGIALVACRGAPSEPEARASDVSRPPPSVSAAAAPAEAAADAGDRDLAMSAYESASPISGKSIGHTSLVFKLRLEGGYDVAFKPRSKKALGTTRYKAEIAAYRLAKALGIDNVPLAMPRTFSATKVREALAPSGGAKDWDREAAPLPDGNVPGALIPWLTSFEIYEGDHGPERARWQEWLMKRGSQMPEDDRWLAGQLSTMLLFDYVTANWDRWSGGNIGVDHVARRVLYVDNDGAFYEAPSVANLNEQLKTIEKVHRFSKSFVAALRDMDEQKMEAIIGDETPGQPLLPSKVIETADQRRQKLLGVVDAKIAADGADAVLYFE